MSENLACRIKARQVELIQQLSDEEQGHVWRLLFAAVFPNSKNQIEFQFEKNGKKSKNQNNIQFDFLSPLAQSILNMVLPDLIARPMRAGGARKGAGRPRKSGNFPKMHIPRNPGFYDEKDSDSDEKIKNQNDIQIEKNGKKSKNQNNIQFDFFNAKNNQIEFQGDANARAMDNLNNNNINNNPEKENISLKGYAKEKAPTKWDNVLAEWNRIAKLYHRPRCRAITPTMQKAISARCQENKLKLSDFLATCEKALAEDKSLRCGTDKWAGADLLYFSRSANFTRALQIADNPQCNNNQNPTAAVLRDFINKGE